MPWPLALLVTFALLASTLYLPLWASWTMVLGTALWAAIDSSAIDVRKYKTGMALHPLAIFIGVAGIWIIGFPWYLIVRGKIKNGTATLKFPARAELPPA